LKKDNQNSDGSLDAVINAALLSVDAATLVKAACQIDVPSQTLQIKQHSFSLAGVKRICVVGAGKASGKMAAGLEEVIAEQADHLSIEIVGQVNVPDDKIIATRGIEVIGCRSPGDNLPTEKVVQQTEAIVGFVKGFQEGDLCIALISGGGSALLELPKIPLEDLVFVSKALSQRGADIESLNTFRRCVSHVKAGGLARMLPEGLPIPMVGMIISDVISDNLGMVSSGPTVVDEFANELDQRRKALEVLRQFMDDQEIPASVLELLQSTVEAPTEVTSSPVTNILIGNNQVAVQAASDAARSVGYDLVAPDQASLDPNGNVNQLGRQYARYLATGTGAENAAALIVGGEPTVSLCESPGTGGRNLQLAAIVLDELLGFETAPAEVQFASVGTDGEDGTAPVAGAWFNQRLLDRLAGDANLRQNLKSAMVNNDCYPFFSGLGYCIESPANVETNVCDLQILLTRSVTAPVDGDS